MNSKKTPHVIK